jgi:hypothetical protein
MSTSYTWTVQNMSSQVQLDGYEDVVVQVGWSCTGTDGTYFATIPGLTRITFGGGPDYTPYDELTEEQVLGWVWSSGVDQTSVQTEIDTQIQLQVNPPIVTLPLPWAA